MFTKLAEVNRWIIAKAITKDNKPLFAVFFKTVKPIDLFSGEDFEFFYDEESAWSFWSKMITDTSQTEKSQNSNFEKIELLARMFLNDIKIHYCNNPEFYTIQLKNVTITIQFDWCIFVTVKEVNNELQFNFFDFNEVIQLLQKYTGE